MSTHPPQRDTSDLRAVARRERARTLAEAHERRLRRRALLHGAGAAVVALALATALGFVVGLAMLPPGALR